METAKQLEFCPVHCGLWVWREYWLLLRKILNHSEWRNFWIRRFGRRWTAARCRSDYHQRHAKHTSPFIQLPFCSPFCVTGIDVARLHRLCNSIVTSYSLVYCTKTFSLGTRMHYLSLYITSWKPPNSFLKQIFSAFSLCHLFCLQIYSRNQKSEGTTYYLAIMFGWNFIYLC